MKNKELLVKFYHGLLDEITADIYGKLPEGEAILEAIAEGVDRAIYRMITNATDMPCADFYDTIEKAARASIYNAVSEKKFKDEE